MRQTVIHLHADAPAKPPAGRPCNGCGVCCSSEPCPLGVLATRRRQGRCAALQWDAASARYRCGFIADPAARLPGALRFAAPLLARLARRWIAAGAGCDSTAQTWAA